MNIKHIFGGFLLSALLLTACTKTAVVIQDPADLPTEPPGNPTGMLRIKLQAVIGVGSIIYDSLPADFSITSWDSTNTAYTTDTVLGPGAQTVLLPANRTHYLFKVNKWGISDELLLDRQEVVENLVYILGGSKAAKRLRMEEEFTFIAGAYQPSGKTIYSYNNNGISQIEFYQKLPQYQELQFTRKHLYVYAGSKVARINVFDGRNTATGYTTFTYNEQANRIIQLHQRSYDVETFAAVEYAAANAQHDISINYLYNNGNTLEYKMKIKGGNKVADHAIGSTGGGETGTYKYDRQINPFAHMNMPDIFLSNLSKNNVVEEQKNYGGSIPSALLYKIEYSYDTVGYPTEVVKHYKGYSSGDHLYQIKTVYTYM